MILKTFGWSFALTIVALAVGFLYGGVAAATITVILIVLEISFSFDNAVVNAKILNRMSAAWQKVFLTVGILIAVVGMRLVFPFVVVGITAKLSPQRALELAFEKGDPDVPGTYGYILNQAHPSIAAFGGIFLLMIFLDFVMDDEKEMHWIDPVERALQKIGSLDRAAVLVAVVVLAVFALFSGDETEEVLISGAFGLITYLVVNGLGNFFEDTMDDEVDHLASDVQTETRTINGVQVAVATGKAAFFLFLYLEVLDASFSFDGVIGAFAITSDPVIIALGLGVGAIYVRSLTVYLVRQGTLAEYRYLEHGAHWAIGVLAVILFVTIEHEVPEVVTGLIGVAFIAAALWWSIRQNKADELAERENEPAAG